MKSGLKSPNNKLKLREALTYVILRKYMREVVVLRDLHTIWTKRRQEQTVSWYKSTLRMLCCLERRNWGRSGIKGKSH